jgi:hypothetical protein
MRSDEPTERWATPASLSGPSITQHGYAWSSLLQRRWPRDARDKPSRFPSSTMPTTPRDRCGPQRQERVFHGEPDAADRPKSFTGNASKQRRSGPSSGPPGIAIGARRNLSELGDDVSFDHPLDGRGEPDLRQAVLRPPVDAIGRLAHEQPAADLEKGSSALRNNRRRAERPGGHDSGGRPVRRIPADVLGSGVDHLNPVSQPQTPAGGDQMISPPELALQQDPGPCRCRKGTGEGGQSAPAAKVENDTGAFTQQLGEGPGMTNVVLEWALTDPTKALGLGQHGGQGLIQGRSRPGGGDPLPRNGSRRPRCR